ncbi:MAG: hypothetical protein AABY64_13175 [Bdellovibrionota bacterium]
MNKIFIAMLMTLLGTSGHAATYTKYICKDRASGKTIALFGVQRDCSALPLGCAYVEYGNYQKAIGTYNYHESQCPSRLCGDYTLQLKARSTGMSPQWPVEFVTIGINNYSGFITGKIQFEMAGKQSPLLFNVECTIQP